MKYYKLYIKHEDGTPSFQFYFNEVDWEHPLAQARRLVKGFYRDRDFTIPEFKKLGEDRWRLNGVHNHPMFFQTRGIWYVELAD